MVDKVRDIVRQLEELEDSVKVDDIQSQLKTVREDAVRQLKDRQELYADGENVIRFGTHRFSVNSQLLDVTTVLREGEMCLHLTGTDFYEPLSNEELDATRDVWDMEVVSENREIYRAEYLAYQMLLAARSDESAFATTDSDELREEVQKFMGPRYSEGYTKGVHDLDAAIILRSLLEIDASCGLLRYQSRAPHGRATVLGAIRGQAVQVADGRETLRFWRGYAALSRHSQTGRVHRRVTGNAG